MRPVFDPVWNLSRGGIRDFQCASGCGPASPHVFMASECMLESRIRRSARTGMLSQARACESPEEQPRGPEKPPWQGERFTSCDQRHLPVKPSARRGAFRRSAGGPPAGRALWLFLPFAVRSPVNRLGVLIREAPILDSVGPGAAGLRAYDGVPIVAAARDRAREASDDADVEPIFRRYGTVDE